ncbi:MAG: TonB-dependent receptor [Sphingobium sp.]|nr:MAG: TonB-dependent receptor [Sphingobium sp.]
MSYSKIALLTSVAVMQFAVAAPVMAQAVDAGETSADGHDANDIVVTAFKREQNVQDIPAAVSAVSGGDLAARGITDPSNLQFITPSLQVGKSQGNTAFTIRGVGFNTVGSPAVAVHVDGVFQPRPGMGDLAQIDVNRVEVLRGPQGTLYGRNANGGVINFLSNRPTNKFEGQLTASYANYDQLYLEGILNAPFGPGAGARLVVAHKEQGDGFVRNVAGGPDLLDEGYTAVRLALDFEPTDTLTVELTGSYVKRDGAIYSSIAQTRPSTSGARGAPFGDLFAFGGDIYAALGAQWSAEPLTTTANDPSSSDRKAYNFSGVLNWKVGDFTVRSITGYQSFSEDHRSDFDGTNVSIYQGRIIRDSDTFTQEINVSGKAGPVDLVVGGFYMDDKYSQDLSINQPNGNGSFLPGALLSFKTPYYNTKSIAAFTDLTFNLTDRFRLIGGLRYSHDRQNTFQDFSINADILAAPGVIINPGQQCLAALPQLNFNSWTPRIGAQLDVSDSSTAYANYTEGFKVGGYNTDGTCNDKYEPEEIKSYEIGIRNSFMGGDLTLNATGFYYKYKNLQLQQIIGTGVSIINAPAARVWGLELEGNYRPNRNLAIFASLAFLDAKYTDFPTFDGAAGTSPPPVNVAGNYLNNAPKFSANLGFSYTPDLDVLGGRINLRADGSYRSETFTREFNDPILERNDPYFIANASIAWTDASDTFTLRAFASNIFNEIYITQNQWSATIQSRAISYNTPRQYGIEARVRF